MKEVTRLFSIARCLYKVPKAVPHTEAQKASVEVIIVSTRVTDTGFLISC